jgi:nitroreductase
MKKIHVGGCGKLRVSAGLIVLFSILSVLGATQAQDIKTIKLPAVNKSRGSSLMDALSKKASAQSLSDKDLSMQDLSDLLWAAGGVNRPDSKKRTYSSAMNTQETDIYVFMKDGVYLYDYANHALTPVVSGDHRADIAGSFSAGGGGMPSGSPPGAAPAGAPAGASGGAPSTGGMPGVAPAGGQPGAPGGAAGGPSASKGGASRLSGFPVDLLIVSDPSKYRAGDDELKKEWAAYSAGMVSQNIMLFCAANDMGTHPRAMFDKPKLKTLLKLKDTQNVIIELPIGYLQK